MAATEQTTDDRRYRLDGRSVFVVGGLGLIGLAVCNELLDLGARVVVLDRAASAEKLEPLRGAGRSVDFVAYDAASTEGIATRVAELEAAQGPADGWINAAFPRTEDWGDGVEEVSAESWRRNVDMQLNAVCLTSNEVASRMAERGGGAIVNLGSIYGCGGPDFRIYEGTQMTSAPAYSAIKAGIANYSRYLASYWGRHGVRVNVICPGGVFDHQHPSFVKAYESRTPLGRMAAPPDVAGPVAFLTTDAAAYITGAVIPVDGGWTAI